MLRVGLFVIVFVLGGSLLTLGSPPAASGVSAANLLPLSDERDPALRVASTLPIFPNVRITDGTSPYDWQVEPTMVVNKSGAIFVGWKEADSAEGAGRRVGFSSSTDGGASWAPNILMPQSHPGQNCANSDPWLALAPDDRAHYAYLEYECSSGLSGIDVVNTTDGKTWGTVHYLNGLGGLSDKESLAVDGNGRLYLAWDEAFLGNEMQVTWSDDGGTSWAPFETPTPGSVLGVIIAAAPNGNVYVTWWDLGGDNILFDWSEDGGQTWHTDIRVNDVPGSAQSSGGWQIPIPAMNVDPATGTIYVFWPDSRNGNQDIFMARSTNGGQTWSANVQVNDDTGSATQYMVDLAIDRTGTVHAVWEDKRSGNWAIFYANSTDGGRTWSQNFPVTEEDTPGTYNRPGDYFAIEAGPDDSIHVVWTDGRDADFDIFFARKLDVPAASVTLTTNPAGLLVRVDGRTEKSPVTKVWPVGSVHNVSTPSPQPIGDTSRYVWSSWSDGGAIAHDVVATADMTLTATFRKQWRATFAVHPSGPSILVDNVSYSAFTTLWWDQGSTHWLDAPSPQGSGPGSRFVWLSWSDGGGQSHSVTATAPSDVTATFQGQYTLSLRTIPSGLNVTVDGVSYASPVSFWFPVGSRHTVGVAASEAGPPGVRYRFLNWTDGGEATHDVTLNGVMDLTAYYVSEFYLTVEAPVPGATGEGWYLSGSTAYATVPTAAVDIGPGERRGFQRWGGDASGMGLTSDGILMDGPKTAVAMYGTQYYLSVQTDHGTAGGAGWYAAGSAAVATLSATDVGVGPGAREHFVGWTGDGSGSGATSDPILMDRPKSTVATWRLQYLLTIQSAYGSPEGGGWYDSASTATASLAVPIIDLGPGKRAVFVGWFGAAAGSDPGASSPIAMTGPKVVLASWQSEYEVRVTTEHGTVEGGGWYVAGSTATLRAPAAVTSGGQTYEFAGWTGDVVSSKTSVSFVVDGPMVVQATWNVAGPLSGLGGVVLIPSSLAVIVVAVLVSLLLLRKRHRKRE